MGELSLRLKAPKLSIGERIAATAYGAKAQWPSGFQLYQRGTPADGIFVVLHGHVVLKTPVKGDRAFVSAIVMAGETFGAEGLGINGTYCTDAYASDEVETLYLGTSQFRAFVREEPAHAIALVGQVMAERATLLERLYEMAAMNVEERLIASLLRLSQDVKFALEDGLIKLDSHHHRLLCEMVGATRESITLAMSRIMSAGDAVRQGTSVVINPKRLRARLNNQRFDIQAPMEVIREFELNA